MKRKLINYLATLLDNTGMNVLQSEESPRKIWRLIVNFAHCTVAVISLSMFSILNYQDFNKFVVPISYMASITAILSGIAIIFYHRKIVTKMLYQMDDNIYNYPDEDTFDIKYKWYLKEDNITTMMSIFIFFQYFCLFSMCLPSMLEFLIEGKINMFLYPPWTPWEMENPRLQVFTLIIQISQGIGGFWLNHVLMVSIFMIVLEFLRQYERLYVAICSLKRRSVVERIKENIGEKQDEAFDKILHENIIHCIKHHQMLHKNFRLFEKWFSVFFSLELAICVLSFAFGLYVLINAPGIGETINYFGVAMVIGVNILGRCFIGEIISDLNDRVKNALFWEIEWNEMIESNRQLIVTFHLILCRPFQLFGFSIFETNRVTFAKIIRITYSAFNIINIAVKK